MPAELLLLLEQSCASLGWWLWLLLVLNIALWVSCYVFCCRPVCSLAYHHFHRTANLEPPQRHPSDTFNIEDLPLAPLGRLDLFDARAQHDTDMQTGSSSSACMSFTIRRTGTRNFAASWRVPKVSDLVQKMQQRRRNPSSSHRRHPSASHRRGPTKRFVSWLRHRSSNHICDFCELQLYAKEGEKHKGKWYHPACFRCANCGGSLRGLQYGQIDDCLYCNEPSKSRGGRNCLAQLQLALAGHTPESAAKEGGNQRLRDSEVELVSQAQQDAIEAIGDDLEDIIDNLAPKCGLCNGKFAASDQLVMQGMVKFHRDCLLASQIGKIQSREVILSPARACASLPATLLMKLQQANGRVMTFFMTRVPESSKKTTTAAWLADETAHASNRRKCPTSNIDVDGGVALRVLGELGADLAPAMRATLGSETDLGASCSWVRSGLRWDLDCKFGHNPSEGLIWGIGINLAIFKVE